VYTKLYSFYTLARGGLHVAAAQPGVREIVIMTAILPLNADCTVFVSEVCFVALVLENTLL
jgi:hypothetical protein